MLAVYASELSSDTLFDPFAPALIPATAARGNWSAA